MRQDGLSVASTYLSLAASTTPEALLISAYDLHHRLLPDVDDLLAGNINDTPYGAPKLLVVDSGGFELSTAWDAGELYRGEHVPKPFSDVDYARLLDAMPTSHNLMVVTYDHAAAESKAIEAQVELARALSDSHPGFMVDMLIKPARNTFLDVAEVSRVAAELASFDMVGVTETELGDSILSRAATIRSLRLALDAAAVAAPIHVFGILDPIMVAYYSMAGAEIFDGLTWMRYGTHRGVSVYRDSVAVTAGRLELDGPLRDATAHLEFLDALGILKARLTTWAHTNDFIVFGDHAGVLRDAFTALDRIPIEGGS